MQVLCARLAAKTRSLAVTPFTNPTNLAIFGAVQDFRIGVANGGDSTGVLLAGAGNASLGSPQAGGSDDDVWWGGGGNHTLTGGTGVDVLHGRGGGEVLIGAVGNDQLVGWVCANLAGWGYDQIFDFSRTEGDRIDMRGSGITSMTGFAAVQTIGSNTQLISGDGSMIDVYGFTGLVAGDFIFS